MKHPLFQALALIGLGALSFVLPMVCAALGLVQLIDVRVFTFMYLVLVHGGAVLLGFGVTMLHEYRKDHKNVRHFIQKSSW